jgi:NADH-quinone oxidoreductase subunit N
MQWHSYDAMHPKDWKGGMQLFPLTQTLFAPEGHAGAIVGGYGMAVVDNFAVFFQLLVSVAGILVLFMSLASRELEARSRRLGEYSALILGMSIGLYLMPASMDLVTIYISIELVSIAGYILAGFSRDTPHAAEASLKYILFGALSSGIMLYGFSLFYGLTGTTNIIAIRQVLALSPATHTGTNLYILWGATVFALAGMGYKISAVPFHNWTPDVYEGAPAPVTALLSVASKAAGFGVLIRFLVFVFPEGGAANAPLINWPVLIAALAAITMTVGNFAALQQSNVRRMLAYSSIAHAGYMLAGLAVGGSAGIVSIMIYLATYLFMQLGAFYAVMLIENKIGSEEIDDYRGLMTRAPLVCAALVLFLASLTGIPLTAGFIGKFYLFSAILTPDPLTHHAEWLWLAVVAILNSVIALYYYLRVAGAMFLKRPLREIALGVQPATTERGAYRYSVPNMILLVVFIVPVFVLGIYFQPLVDFASGVVRFFSFNNLRY